MSLGWRPGGLSREGWLGLSGFAAAHSTPPTEVVRNRFVLKG